MKSLSIFSGCMGLDLGLEKAGIKPLAYVDLDSACRATIRANRPNAKIFEDVFAQDVLDFASDADIDVVVGGPPCQSFSTIGKRAFLSDDRGKALLGFIDIIRVAQPEFFILENVQGLLFAQDGYLVEQISRRFHKLGYHVTWSVLNAADLGVPQARRRFVMIGCKSNPIEITYLKRPTKTLKQAIGDLESKSGEGVLFSDAMCSIMSHVPEGGCWRDLPKKIQDKAMGKANKQSGGLTAFYRRLCYDRPSPTLLTSPAQRATTLCHPKHTRPLNIDEYKRIQCFPDNWKVIGSVREKYRQIGNAVPVLMGQVLGNLINR